MVIVLVVLTAAAVSIGSAVVARHQAQAAADLAALAGATHVAAGRSAACESAASVARAMRAGIAACTVDALDVVVAVEVVVGLGRLGAHTASASARAGPVINAGSANP